MDGSVTVAAGDEAGLWVVTTRRGSVCGKQRYVCPTREIAEKFAALLLSAPAAARRPSRPLRLREP